MKRQVLIGDNTAFLGKRIARGLLHMGVLSSCCKGGRETIIRRIEEMSPKMVIIIVPDPDDGSEQFVAELREKFPDTVIAAGIYSSQDGVYRRFLKAGAAHCFGIPIDKERLFSDLTRTLSGIDKSNSFAEILLRSYGFPTHIKGFRYLSAAIEMCTEDTSLLSGGIIHLYSMIAEKYRTSPSPVERSIRSLTAAAEQNGSLRFLMLDRMNEIPANKELICLACDTYVYFLKRIAP